MYEEEILEDDFELPSWCSSCYACLPKLQEMKSRPLEVEMKLNDWQPAVGGGGWERGRAHNLIALHLSLEVPPVELEVTGKVQEIFCLRQFLGS